MMDTWLILIGVLLPLAPMLQILDRRLDDDDRPATVPVDAKSRPRA
jgi:hypothetical protein